MGRSGLGQAGWVGLSPCCGAVYFSLEGRGGPRAWAVSPLPASKGSSCWEQAWRVRRGCSRLAGDRGVPGHSFGGHVVVAVRTVQEGLPALAGSGPSMQHEARARLRVQGAAARRWCGPILCLEAVRGWARREVRGAAMVLGRSRGIRLPRKFLVEAGGADRRH